jgi:hypothetical protein
MLPAFDSQEPSLQDDAEDHDPLETREWLEALEAERILDPVGGAVNIIARRRSPATLTPLSIC